MQFALLHATSLEKWILSFNIYGNWAGEGRNVLGFPFWEGKLSGRKCPEEYVHGMKCPITLWQTT